MLLSLFPFSMCYYLSASLTLDALDYFSSLLPPLPSQMPFLFLVLPSYHSLLFSPAFLPLFFPFFIPCTKLHIFQSIPSPIFYLPFFPLPFISFLVRPFHFLPYSSLSIISSLTPPWDFLSLLPSPISFLWAWTASRLSHCIFCC